MLLIVLAKSVRGVIASRSTAPAPFIHDETVIANERSLRVTCTTKWQAIPWLLEIASGRESTGLRNDIVEFLRRSVLRDDLYHVVASNPPIGEEIASLA